MLRNFAIARSRRRNERWIRLVECTFCSNNGQCFGVVQIDGHGRSSIEVPIFEMYYIKNSILE